MKLYLSTQLLLRTPSIPTNQTLEQSFEELKTKIAESSPIFHALIKDLHPNDLPHQPEKIQYTLWKYFNRAQHRATPFGTFAAITLLPLTYQTNPPILQNKLITHRWTNWAQAPDFSKNSLSNTKELLTNSSVYYLENQIRYLHSQNEKFELATIESTPAIQAILEACKNKCHHQAIYKLLDQTHHISKQAATKLLEQLISLQLLYTDQQPNITGTDYFQRLGITAPAVPSDYIISERKTLSGSFDGRLLRHLPAYIDFLCSHIQPANPQELNKFIQAFQQRYEGRQIPLPELMDPEIGLGYGNFEQPLATSQAPNFQTNTNQKDQQNQHPNYQSTKLNQFLLQKLISGSPIDLNEFSIEQAAQAKQRNQTQAIQLPNTLSAVFHRYKDNIVLSELGGATATALLGRFTPCSQQIETFARGLAELEQQSNPDVLFFDIAYMGEPAVDNINRRKQLYPYELPLVCWSEAPQTLTLADILVSVQGGQVILISKNLEKRLIPRIPSAYNYTRSELPIYRFLCDIQSQGLAVNFHFSLKDHFPGLSFYPRVYLKS